MVHAEICHFTIFCNKTKIVAICGVELTRHTSLVPRVLPTAPHEQNQSKHDFAYINAAVLILWAEARWSYLELGFGLSELCSSISAVIIFSFPATSNRGLEFPNWNLKIFPEQFKTKNMTSHKDSNGLLLNWWRTVRLYNAPKLIMLYFQNFVAEPLFTIFQILPDEASKTRISHAQSFRRKLSSTSIFMFCFQKYHKSVCYRCDTLLFFQKSRSFIKNPVNSTLTKTGWYHQILLTLSIKFESNKS